MRQLKKGGGSSALAATGRRRVSNRLSPPPVPSRGHVLKDSRGGGCVPSLHTRFLVWVALPNTNCPHTQKKQHPLFPQFSNTNNDFFHSFQVNTSKALARGAAEGGGPGAALVCAAFGLSPPPPPCAADKRKKSPLQLVELSPPFFFPRPLCVNNTPGRGDRAKKRCASTSFGKKMCPHFFTRRQQHNPFSLSLTHHDTQIHLITSAACT